MKTTARDEQEKTKSFRRAFAARDEAMVRGFATQFAIRHEDARKYPEGADWNYGRAFDALLVSVSHGGGNHRFVVSTTREHTRSLTA
jgi:hypothetical protein